MAYAFLIVNHCLLVEMRDLTYAMADICEGISMIKLWMPVFIIFINANLIHNIFALIKNIAKISESLELKGKQFFVFQICVYKLFLPVSTSSTTIIHIFSWQMSINLSCRFDTDSIRHSFYCTKGLKNTIEKFSLYFYCFISWNLCNFDHVDSLFILLTI